MLYRTLGRTGLEVSELGFGAWGIGGTGWIGADDGESVRALRLAIERGVNFLDTAYAYGDGHSERLVGDAVRESAETVYVATKVPPRNMRWPARPGVRAEEAFPADWIVGCTERSLERLGVETIDVQQLHVWSDEWVEQGDWLDAVEQLKRDGKIRFFGISINDHQPENAIRLVESGLVDTVQVIYNVFDQSPEDALFPAVEAARVGVIVRVPFEEGALTGSVGPETTFPDGDFRNRYFAGERKREIWERVQAIARDLDVEEDRLAEIALRFCLGHPATSVVVPGMRSTRNVERNVRAASAGPLEESQLAVLRRHRWVDDFDWQSPS
jgi:aryl-alcohol dehydrogenase-like predicted oxidoreductase